jgi:hypothetical protein
MKASGIKYSLELAYKLKIPCFIWGAVGIGKSDTVRQTATDLGIDLIDIRVALLDPVDLRGLPAIQNGKAHWCIPDFLPTSGKGILFLDELSSATPLVQAACYQLVLDRKLGEYTIPEGWSVVAAGNRESDKAIVHRMSTALSNRFAYHLNFEFSLDEWCTWAFAHEIQPEIVGYARFRPSIFDFDAAKITSKAFPTPRSVAMASRIIAAKPQPDLELELLSGCIGEGEAIELLSFLKIYRTLPNPDVILLTPDTALVPDDPATLYAITTALSRKATEANIDRLMVYANRLPEEFSVLLIRDAIRHTPKIVNTKAFITWSVKHSEVLTGNVS